MLLRLALLAATLTVGTAQSLHANISFVVGEWRCFLDTNIDGSCAWM